MAVEDFGAVGPRAVVVPTSSGRLQKGSFDLEFDHIKRPEAFYLCLGFQPTGETFGGEVVAQISVG